MVPPVGYRTGVGSLLWTAARAATSRGYRQQVLEPHLAETCGVRFASTVSSGKAALALILKALHQLSGRRAVVIPAYTCYSLPSAVLKAGFDVLPCDIGPSFDYDEEALATLLDRDDILCVVSVHLFGIPSDTPRLMTVCRDRGIFVVEDAAQAFGASVDGRRLGTSGDVGFFSVGRGKHVNAGGGGIIVSGAPAVTEALKRVTAAVPDATAGQSLQTFAALFAMRWLISPSLYWLPLGLPFLRLGETIFHEDFPIRRLSTFQAHLLHEWPLLVERLNAIRMEHSTYYLQHVRSGAPRAALPYLRYPVVLPDAVSRRRLLAELDGGRLGISRMYPGSVAEIPTLRPQLAQTRFPEAERVADCLVTLPTHPLVSARERATIAALVNDAIGSVWGPVEAPMTPTLPHTP